MKTHTAPLCLRLPVTVCTAASFLLLIAPAARAYTNNELEIGVRADVEEPVQTTAKSGELPRDAAALGKIFALTPAQLAPSVEKLVKPVEQDALLVQLLQVLQRNDFRPARPGEAPEIVITLHYGRGFLRNPYFGFGYGMQNALSSSAPTVTIIMPTMDNIHGMGHGVEAKRQKAEYEKLFLLVSAWDVPKAKGVKPHRLWKTLIYVDDPDHRDLGGVFKQMLAAGGPYFGQKIKQEEVEINTALPEGHVKLGPTTVVEEPKNPTK